MIVYEIDTRSITMSQMIGKHVNAKIYSIFERSYLEYCILNGYNMIIIKENDSSNISSANPSLPQLNKCSLAPCSRHR